MLFTLAMRSICYRKLDSQPVILPCAGLNMFISIVVLALYSIRVLEKVWVLAAGLIDEWLGHRFFICSHRVTDSMSECICAMRRNQTKCYNRSDPD
jgi:hypothetical protein